MNRYRILDLIFVLLLLVVFCSLSKNVGEFSQKLANIEDKLKHKEKCVVYVNYDGEYDFNTLLLRQGLNYDAMQASLVWLYTKSIFLIDKKKKIAEKFGTGTVVSLMGEKYILTASHVVNTDWIKIEIGGGATLANRNRVEQITFLCSNGDEKEIKPVVIDKDLDFALFKLPDNINIPAFPYKFGKSENLKTGNIVYLFGRPFNSSKGIARQGIVGSKTALQEVNPLDRKIEEDIEMDEIFMKANSLFCVTNGMNLGDSGSMIIALRDGTPEIVGIAQSVLYGAEQIGFALKIGPVLEKINKVLK